MKRVDMGVGWALILLSVWMFWYAGRYQDVAVHVYGPNLFPRVLSALMFVLAVGLIVNAHLGRAMALGERIDPWGFGRVLVSIVLCVGYVVLIHWLGFASSTFLFLIALMALVRQRGIWLRLFAALVTSLLVWAIFRYLLVIPLPEGLLI